MLSRRNRVQDFTVFCQGLVDAIAGGVGAVMKLSVQFSLLHQKLGQQGLTCPQIAEACPQIAKQIANASSAVCGFFSQLADSNGIGFCARFNPAQAIFRFVRRR